MRGRRRLGAADGVIGPHGGGAVRTWGRVDADTDTDTERETVADQDERQHRPRDRALVERAPGPRAELKLTEREDDADARDRAADTRDRTADQRITVPMSGTGR
jgi:hypothetical protein